MERVVPLLAKLSALWVGRVPLRTAFWNYAVFWGVLVNLAATLMSMAVLVLAGGGPDPAPWVAILSLGLHLLPAPYNLLVLVGVWRSAGSPARSKGETWLARAVIAAWTAVLMLT
jgi:hypothetical protein